MEKLRLPRTAAVRSAVLFDGPCDAAVTRAVRQQLGVVGREWGQSEDFVADTSLVLTELVSNAVRAGASHVRVDLYEVNDTVPMIELEVTDDAPGLPQPRNAGPHDDSGRGLQVVSGVAVDWGFVPLEPAGKTVWARIPPLPTA